MKRPKYTGVLARPSMEPYPSHHPSLHRVSLWERKQKAAQNKGIKLLCKYYGIKVSSNKPDNGDLSRLVVALAQASGVPYFNKPKRSRRSAWTPHHLAVLFNEVHKEQVRNGVRLRGNLSWILRAVLHASRSRFPKSAPMPGSDEKIYRRARDAFDGLVKIQVDGSLKPVSELAGRLWASMLEDTGDSESVTFSPDPTGLDRHAILVSGLKVIVNSEK